jgi:hypothetical protein
VIRAVAGEINRNIVNINEAAESSAEQVGKTATATASEE